MKEIELGEVQAAFADIIWANEPVGSGELVKLCENRFNWKKPTTYTVLRKLCEKGLFKNDDGIVTSLISFIAAFMSHKKLSSGDIDEIQKMIDKYREG